MPANNFSLGRDLQLVLSDASQGGLQSFNIITMVDFKQITKQITSTGVDGTVRRAELPMGWSMDIDLDRGDGNLLNYFIATEGAYFNGGVQAPVYIQATITNPDGTIQQFRLTGGVLKLDNAGSFKGDDKVPQKISGMFSRIQRVI